MNTERMERRLSAVLAVDVAGYSRLMGLDEEGTLARLKAHRRALIDPKIAEHRGRIVKTTGDGLLLEFASVVDAVRCSADVQRGMIERNADLPQEKRIQFRMGINVGDIIIEGGDIFGDGVNVAARLEGIAEPGGVCLSEDAYRQISGRIHIPLRDLGLRSLKNIAQPVRVYSLGAEAIAALPPVVLPALRPMRPRSKIVWQTATGLLVIIVITASAAVWRFQSTVTTPVAPPVPSDRTRLSFVVLPFVNLSGDSTQDYLADVISDELTTSLSRLPDSLVISRSTAFTYKGKPIDVRQVGKDLSVRYALEGSVQPTGDRLRVHAQLIDTERDSHIWADQFDESRADVLLMQDDIVARVAHAIGVKMLVEATRLAQTRGASPSAQDLALRCSAAMMRADFSQGRDAGYQLCEQALQFDQKNVLALTLLSLAFSYRVVNFASFEPQADIRRADELASSAIKFDPDFFLAHVAKGDALWPQGRYRDAIDAYQRALSLGLSNVYAYAGLATAHNFLGEPEKAIACVDKAIRLSPRDPFAADMYLTKVMAYSIMQNYEEALVWLRRAEAAAPDRPINGLARSSLLALAGHDAPARETMQRYLASNSPRIRTIGQWQRIILQRPSESPRFLSYRQKFIEGLRKAGMPDQ